MADLKKFLDKQGVSTLWSKIAEKVAAEAEARDAAIAAAVADINSDLDAVKLNVADNAADILAVDTKVGALPEGHADVIAFINKKAEETLQAASGNSSETAASVKAQLDAYKTANDAAVALKADKTAVDAIEARVAANEDAIEVLNGTADVEGSVDAKIAAAVAAIMENPDETLNSIKELVKWTQDHAADALEMSNNVAANTGAIDALENWVTDHTEDALEMSNNISANAAAITALQGLVGEENVADQIAEAIAGALNLDGAAKYALATDLAAAIVRIAAIEADYLKAVDKTELADAIALKADATALADVKATADAAATQVDLEAEAALARAAEKANADAIAAIVALTDAEIEEAIAAVAQA